MLSILTRSIPRRTFVQSARWVSQKPPIPPSSSRKKIKPTPQQKPRSETAQTPAADTTTPKSESKPEPLESTPEPQPSIPVAGVPSLDFSPPEPEEFQRTGARSSKGTLSTNERKRRFMTRVSLALLTLAFGANALYMGREWDDEELKDKKMKREDAPSTRWGRTKERFSDLFDVFNKPAWPELLPPPYPPPHQKPYTLLIAVDDLLVTSTWDRQHGWRTAKRPGVDYFLAYVSQFYEVVIFTTQPSYTASPILDKLDRYGFFINYRLFREATRTLDGKIVKDLSYLNRDLSKVIMLDTDPEHVSTHPENAIILPKWKGDPRDKNLVAMIPFLESIAIYKPTDVRPVLKAYEGKDIPVEYGKIEAEMKRKHIEEWKAKHKHAAAPASFSSLFGLSSAAPQPKNVPPPTYLEQKRKEAQKQYMEEQKYIQDHKEDLERLLEQDQQAMAAQVPGNLWEAMDQLRGIAPPPPPPPGYPNPVGTSAAPSGSSAAAAASASTSSPQKA